MKRIVSLFLLIALSTSMLPAQKLKDYIQKKKQVVERELDRKADQKIREGVDNLFNRNSGENNGSNGDNHNNNDSKNVTNTTEKLTDVYEFDLAVDYDLSFYEKKKKSTSEHQLTQLFTQHEYFGTQVEEGGQSVVTIIDVPNNRALLVMKSMKTAIVTKIADAQETTKTNDSEGATDVASSTTKTGRTGGTASDQPSFQKTGKQEKIAGYTCDQYLWSDDGIEGEMWIAHDIDYDGTAPFSGASKLQLSLPEDAPTSGVMMRFKGVDEDGNITTLEAKKVAKKKTSFDMNGYLIQRYN